MGDTDLKEKIEKNTMKLPGKSVLVFMFVATGVFVVYYFNNRSEDLQTDADKKSDLVWLQKILNENNHKLTNHRTGHVKQKVKPNFHFYENHDDDYAYDTGPDSYDDDGFETYTDYNDDTDHDTDINWGLRNKDRMPSAPSKRLPSRLKPEYDRNHGEKYRNYHYRLNDDYSEDGRNKFYSGSADSQEKVFSKFKSEDVKINGDSSRETSEQYGQTTGILNKLLSTDWQEGGGLKDQNSGERRKWYHAKASNIQNKFLSVDRFRQYKPQPEVGVQIETVLNDYHTDTKSEEIQSTTINDKYVSESTTFPLFTTSSSTDSSYSEKSIYRVRTQMVENKEISTNVNVSNTPKIPWYLSKDRKVSINSGNQQNNETKNYNVDNVAGHEIYPSRAPVKITEAPPRKPDIKTVSVTNKLLNINTPKPGLPIYSNDRDKQVPGPKQQEILPIKDQQISTKNQTIVAKTDGKKDEIIEAKEHLYYPKYMNVFDWSTPHKSTVKPQCVPMQTVSNYVRVCIHPVEEDPDVSRRLKSQASWEFNSMRDVEIAVLEEDGTGLIDLGAGLGEYSLAIGSFERHAIAVEPYQPHVDIFQASVRLNKFESYITLIRNAISDKNYWVKMEHGSGNINDVTFKSLLDNQVPNDSCVRTITLNQLANYVPFKKAVLKIDIPNFIKKALSESDELFKRVDIKYVCTHWAHVEGADKDFLVNFFKDLGYIPHTHLHGGKLNYETNNTWTYPYIFWAKS